MQSLYMMATLVREQQMLKMAKEIVRGLISIDEAMVQYNVTSREAVAQRVENLKKEIKGRTSREQSGSINLNIQAA